MKTDKKEKCINALCSGCCSVLLSPQWVQKLIEILCWTLSKQITLEKFRIEVLSFAKFTSGDLNYKSWIWCCFSKLWEWLRLNWDIKFLAHWTKGIALNNIGVIHCLPLKKLSFEYSYLPGYLYHTGIYIVGRGFDAKVEKIGLTSIFKKKGRSFKF